MNFRFVGQVSQRYLNYTSKFEFSSRTLASALQEQISKNQYRNAVRFENQNKLWTFKELHAHSDAFATGLVELGFKKGDKFLFWVDKSFTSEVTAAQVGLSKAGVSIVSAEIKDAKQLDDTIKETGCKGLLYSPSLKIGDKKVSEIIKDLIPELEKSYPGQETKISKYPNLKHLIHTGFYTQPGCLKYRQLLVYGRPKFNTNKVPEDINEKTVLFYSKNNGQYKSFTQGDIHAKAQEFRKKNSVGENDSILVVGDSNAPSVFALGVYQSLAFGNYVILSGNQKFKDVVSNLNIQKCNHVILNHELNDADTKTSLDQSTVQVIKNIFTTSNADLIPSVFGQKKPNVFQAYTL